MRAAIVLTLFFIAAVAAGPFERPEIENKLSNHIKHGEHARYRRSSCEDDAPCKKICIAKGIDDGRCGPSGTCQCLSGAGDRACQAKCVSDGFNVGRMTASGVCACRDNWDGW